MAVKRFIINPLTPKQKAIVDFILDYQHHNGYSPSLSEIARHFENSAPTIYEHIELIKRKGYLQKLNFQSRGIAPVATHELIKIPLLGRIAAGNPIEPIENPEPIAVPKTMILGNPTNYYALEVTGDSMIEDGIWDGDTILVKHQQTMPNIGETIVAVTDGEVTLKRFGGINNGLATLIPRNPTMPPFTVPADTFEVRGKFAGLIRHA